MVSKPSPCPQAHSQEWVLGRVKALLCPFRGRVGHGEQDMTSSTLLEADPEPWTLSPRLQELAPQACARLAGEAWSLAEPQS